MYPQTKRSNLSNSSNANSNLDKPQHNILKRRISPPLPKQHPPINVLTFSGFLDAGASTYPRRGWRIIKRPDARENLLRSARNIIRSFVSCLIPALSSEAVGYVSEGTSGRPRVTFWLLVCPLRAMIDGPFSTLPPSLPLPLFLLFSSSPLVPPPPQDEKRRRRRRILRRDDL